jgi:hypothetical protein
VTASTKNRYGTDSDTSHDANNRAVERAISLLNEVVAKGVLPAL